MQGRDHLSKSPRRELVPPVPDAPGGNHRAAASWVHGTGLGPPSRWWLLTTCCAVEELPEPNSEASSSPNLRAKISVEAALPRHSSCQCKSGYQKLVKQCETNYGPYCRALRWWRVSCHALLPSEPSELVHMARGERMLPLAARLHARQGGHDAGAGGQMLSNQPQLACTLDSGHSTPAAWPPASQ